MSGTTAWLGVIAHVVAVVWTTAAAIAIGGVAWLVLTGHSLEVVTTGSMAPSSPQGALAILEDVDPADVRVGDVITFEHPDLVPLLMHRVVDVHEQDGGRFFRTQGDANAAADGRAVPARDVRGRLRWRLPHLGAAATWLRPPRGLIVLVGVPLVGTALAEARARRSSTTRGDRIVGGRIGGDEHGGDRFGGAQIDGGRASGDRTGLDQTGAGTWTDTDDSSAGGGVHDLASASSGPGSALHSLPRSVPASSHSSPTR